jgi:hypothetical protein
MVKHGVQVANAANTGNRHRMLIFLHKSHSLSIHSLENDTENRVQLRGEHSHGKKLTLHKQEREKRTLTIASR